MEYRTEKRWVLLNEIASYARRHCPFLQTSNKDKFKQCKVLLDKEIIQLLDEELNEELDSWFPDGIQ